MSISEEINDLALGEEDTEKRFMPKAPPGFLNLKEFSEALGMSRSQVNRFIVKGVLPPPIRISESRSFWRVRDATDYLEACVAKRDAQWRKST